MAHVSTFPTGTTTQIQLPQILTGGALRRIMGLLLVAVRLARRPELLAQLKGPAISVLLALALRADKHHSCFPSIDRLAKDTGYSRTTVCKGLDVLEKTGLVKRIRRHRTSTLYVIRQPGESPSAPENGPRQKVASRPPAPDAPPASREKPSAPAPKPSSAPRREPVAGSVAPRQPAREETRQMHLGEWAEVNRELIAVGIVDAVAHELISLQKARGHEPGYVRAWLKAYHDGLEANRISGPGWLVSALRNGWTLPKAYQVEKDKNRLLTPEEFLDFDVYMEKAAEETRLYVEDYRKHMGKLPWEE